MLLVSSGDRDFSLLRLEGDRIYPGLQEPIANAITLKLQAIQTSWVEQLADSDDSEGRRWLGQRLGEELGEEVADGVSLTPSKESLSSLVSVLSQPHTQQPPQP